MRDTMLTMRIEALLQALDVAARREPAVTEAGSPELPRAVESPPAQVTYDVSEVIAESQRLHTQSLQIADETRRLCDAIRMTCDANTVMRMELRDQGYHKQDSTN